MLESNPGRARNGKEPGDACRLALLFQRTRLMPRSINWTITSALSKAHACVPSRVQCGETFLERNQFGAIVNRPTEARTSDAQSFRLLQFFLGTFNDFSRINAHGGGNSQDRFQSGISFAVFDVSNHLRRKAGFLRNKVLRQLPPLAFLPQKRDNFDAKCSGVSIHAPQLQENLIDSAFHYGGIVRGRLGIS